MTHSVCVCNAHQDVVLLVDAKDWGLTFKDVIKKIATLRAVNASYIGVNPVLALQLWKNFLIRNSTDMKMMRNLITVSWKLRIEQPLRRLQRDFDWCYWWFYKIFLYSKAKNYQFLTGTTGVNNIISYSSWLYTTWYQMVAPNIIHCVLVLV